MNRPYGVFVLFDGYCKDIAGELDVMEVNCTCTLIKGNKNIIVDTMTPWDRNILLVALKEHDVAPEDINYVVSTHGHSDHTGNNHLFLNAIHIVGFCVSYKHKYWDHPFRADVPYRLDDGVNVIATPGHTLSDVSVVVENVEGKGTVVVAGDLFENESDVTDDSVWKSAGSENEELQKKNREKVMQLADWIVPGHGKMFQIKRGTNT